MLFLSKSILPRPAKLPVCFYDTHEAYNMYFKSTYFYLQKKKPVSFE
jgi:hypothetical protein